MTSSALTRAAKTTSGAPDTKTLVSTGFYARIGKRLLDISFALMLLPIAAVLMLPLWVLVRRDGAPGFYAHERVGRNGRPFKCWKLRTMAANSEEILKAHLAANPQAREEWAANFKLADDPRITSTGDFLRRSSLDELPQLWNVLRGDMSLVGPRPVTNCELERYGDHIADYLSATPGITGAWQVSGRNALSYRDRVALDSAYVSDLRFSRDLRILLQTAGVVLKANGK